MQDPCIIADIHDDTIIEFGRDVIQTELNEAQQLLQRLKKDFAEACRLIAQCQGKVIITGIGKSGHIGKKIAASLASTGSPAFFVHPAEALHGDLGMATKGDLIILISYSGEASEFKFMLPRLQELGLKTIAMTGNSSSFLASSCDLFMDISATQEACPLGLAPTSSAVNTLMMGDALAISAMRMRNFDHHDFARSHPAGSLGAKLLLKVDNVIDTALASPQCSPHNTLVEAISLLCASGLGLLAVVENRKVVGVFTDGDLRRALEKESALNQSVGETMTRNFIASRQGELCSQALTIMLDNSITALPVLDDEQHFIGVVNLTQLHKAGIY